MAKVYKHKTLVETYLLIVDGAKYSIYKNGPNNDTWIVIKTIVGSDFSPYEELTMKQFGDLLKDKALLDKIGMDLLSKIANGK